MEKSKILPNITEKKNKGFLLLLFFISPIIALFYALTNFSKKNFQVIILMFAFLYGYTFLFIENSDTERYIEFYKLVSQFNFVDYIDQILNIYTGDVKFHDLYMVSVMYICSLFNLKFNFFLGVHAVIYFTLLLKITNLILKKIPNLNYRKHLIFLLGCIFTYSFSSGLISIRFPTGFLFFNFFALKYLFSNKWKYLVLAGLSCLIHIAIIPIYAGLILFHFISFFKSYYLKVLVVLIFMLIVNSMNIFDLTQSIDSEVVSSKVNGYTNKNFINNREGQTENWNWYIQVRQYATYYFLIVALLITKINFFKLKTNALINRFYILSMIFFVISVFNESFLDSISNRYRLFFQFVGLLYLFFLFSYNKKSSLSFALRNVFTLIFILNFLVGLRVDSYTFDIIRLTLSPVFIVIGYEGANIYNLI